MRAIIALLAFAFTTTVLHAQSVRVTGARVTSAGIYEQVGEQKKIQLKSVSTGTRYETRMRFVSPGTTIPMRDRTLFGATFDVSGSPQGASSVLRAVWRYPSPGIDGRMVDEVPANVVIGSPQNTQSWNIVTSSGLPLGVWTLELWDGSRLLATQQFKLVRSQ
jgi:hypothetical protein